ncbi:MAG: AsmA family protein [Hyphomonadaceae bacterium]
MRWLLIILGVFLGAVALLAVAFFLFFPKEEVRQQIERQVETATERDLSLTRVSLTVWPALGLTADGVSLSNPRGMAGEPFLQAQSAVFAVAIMPLLRGDIEVRRIILEGPQLALQVDQRGTANWIFPETEDQTRIETLRIDDFRINHGRLSYSGPVGEPMVAEDVNANIRLESLDSPATLEGAFRYRDQPSTLNATFASPRAFLEGGMSAMDATFETEHLNATLNGQFAARTGAVTGRLRANGDSLRQTLAWLGSPMGAGAGFAAYSAEADMQARGAYEETPTTIALTNGTFAVDAVRASGAVTITMNEAGRMRATGTLTIPTLDANPYLAPAPGQAANASAAQGVNTQAAWPTTPIDLSGLTAADADLNLTIQTLRFQRMTFTNAALRLGIEAGVLDARLSRVALYGGSGAMRLIAHAAGNRIQSEIDAQNVQAEALLRDAIGFDRIAGRGRLRAQLTGAGAHQAAIMRSLGGTASFTFNDGRYRGVDLALVARSIQSALSGQARGPSASTDFAELAASFRVNNGVAVTEDLRMLNPFVRLEGQGVIDIGQQTIDMRIAPRAVNSMQGQGGQAGIAGIGVPFRVHGPWSRPQYGLALGDAVQNQIRERMRGALQGAAPAGLGGLFPGAQQQEQQPANDNAQPQQQQQQQRPSLPDLGSLIPGR